MTVSLYTHGAHIIITYKADNTDLIHRHFDVYLESYMRILEQHIRQDLTRTFPNFDVQVKIQV